MNRVRLLIIAALLACIGVASCKAPAVGTATISDNKSVFSSGILKSGEALGETVIVTIDLADVAYADDFAADDTAVSWFKCKDGDGKETAVASLGGIKATASPASSGEDKKDRIVIAFSADKLSATDTILSSVEIPASKLSSKSSLLVKLGDDGIHVKVVNVGVSNYSVDGASFVGLSGEPGAASASAVTVSYKITDAFVIAGENPVYTNVDVTEWFELKDDNTKTLADMKIKAKADFTASQNGQDAPRDTMVVTFSTMDSSAQQTNAAEPGNRSYRLVIPAVNLENSPEGIAIEDAVRILTTKKNADRSAVVDDGSATSGEVEIKGQTDYEIDVENKSRGPYVPYAVTIALDGDYFNGLVADQGKTYKNVNDWFGLSPDDGWECTIEESDLAAAVNGSSKVKVTLGGKITRMLTGKIGIVIPGENLVSGQQLTIESSDANNKMSIAVRLTPEARFDVEVDKISGNVGVAMGDYEFTLDVSVDSLDNVKLKSIDQGVNVSDWFNLPKGLAATTANGITLLGSKTLQIKISGTPQEAFDEEFIVSIPGDKWIYEDKGGIDGGLYFRLKAADVRKWNITAE